MKYSKKDSKRSAKKSSNKNKTMRTKKGGSKGSSYITHRLPMDVSKLIDAFIDPVHALHLENSQWSVENTHGLNLEIKYGHQEKFNKVFLDTYGKRDGQYTTYQYKLCGDSKLYKQVVKENDYGSDDTEDDNPDVPLRDVEDEKYIKLGLREDKTFVSTLGEFIDRDMKTYILEHKLSKLDPKDAHIDSVVIGIRFGDILATTLFNLGGKFVEHVFEIHPTTKKVSRYWGAEDIITPPVKLDSNDIKKLNFYKLVKDSNTTNATVDKWKKHNALNTELYAQAEEIKQARKIREITRDESKILTKAEKADKYRCSVHVDAHAEKLKEITLNRYILRTILQDDELHDFFRECENFDIEQPYRYPEVGDYKTQPKTRAINRKIMKVINDSIKKNNGNKNAAIHELLRIAVTVLSSLNLACNEVFTIEISEELNRIDDHDQVGELYGERYPYVV